MNNVAAGPAPRPSAGVNESSGAISVGEGSSKVDLYFDFYCPHCQDFEAALGPDIAQQLDSNAITLNMHPVALSGLNAASGTDFSERAANALYCVAGSAPEAAYPFMAALFERRPSGPGLSDDDLIALADGVGAADTDRCIRDRTWDALVSEQSANIPENPETGGSGTPTLLIDGEFIPVTLDPQQDLLSRIG